jgi:serine-type D-Ala-D-Ala carboxypeptidase/endopeptidase (penicillin-binding protein 4)
MHSNRARIAAGLLLIAGCASAPPAAAPKANPRAERSLAADLDRIFNAHITSQALWGVAVKSLDTGRVLYARNARTLMMPASNMKIVTLATAAETLGWDHRFKTTLETSGAIEGGVLKGDLIVRGGGDPTINRRDNRATAVFDQWAAALKSAGITRIEGNVVGDASAFDRQLLGQGWSWDYLQAGYAAPVSALELNENIATLTVVPGAAVGDDARLELTMSSGVGLVHHVTTGPSGSATSIDVERVPEGGWVDVTGTIAVDARPVSRDVAVANPALFFAHSLLNALVERGIAVRGLPKELRDGKTPIAPLPRQTLVTTESPPLRDIATTMMKVSQNLYAETLLKAVGAAKSGVGTTEGDLRRLEHPAWLVRDRRRLWAVALRLPHAGDADRAPRAPPRRPAPSRRLRRDAPDRGKGRNDLDAPARDTRRSQRDRQDRFDLQRPRAVRLRPHARRRAAGVLDPRQQLHDPGRDRQLDR